MLLCGEVEGWEDINMPFKSQAQAKKLAILTAQGKFPMKSFREWANATPSLKKLPKKVKKK